MAKPCKAWPAQVCLSLKPHASSSMPSWRRCCMTIVLCEDIGNATEHTRPVTTAMLQSVRIRTTLRAEAQPAPSSEIAILQSMHLVVVTFVGIDSIYNFRRQNAYAFFPLEKDTAAYRQTTDIISVETRARQPTCLDLPRLAEPNISVAAGCFALRQPSPAHWPRLA